MSSEILTDLSCALDLARFNDNEASFWTALIRLLNHCQGYGIQESEISLIESNRDPTYQPSGNGFLESIRLVHFLLSDAKMTCAEHSELFAALEQTIDAYIVLRVELVMAEPFASNTSCA